MTRAVVGYDQGDTPAPSVDMTTTLGWFAMPSPVLTASGCAASGRELDQFFDVSTLGAMVTKSIMLEPRSGRATPRMAETPSGMLNSIGLQGPGIHDFIEHDLAWLRQRGVRTIVSIAGSTTQEYEELAKILRPHDGVDAIEVNISCPNVADRGQVFACRADTASGVIASVRRSIDPSVPVLAKLSPDVTDIATIAVACHRAGADGLTLINTTLGMVIDVDTMRPALAGVTGGLSGPAIRPIAVRCVWQVRQALPDMPILGVGGIRTGRDALEFILAGAHAVSVGTVVFHDPSAPKRIHAELASELAARGFSSLSDAISHAHRPPDAESLEALEDDEINPPEWV
ncbi:MAG: dihydroorotate dehydrogenase [Actinobacteria bacterium]|nr:dihydroorotate dehydrogenase [Actinomycetota bacterium]